jgi:regulator of sigma E protease
MSDFLTSLIAVVAVLGFMILIHEFGHYAVAKWLGVRVEQFAIGFGKRLIGFRKGETDYRINAIPLGGYVKMSGENPMDERSDDPREFMNHSRWHRFLIAIAGPTMNILLAIVLLHRRLGSKLATALLALMELKIRLGSKSICSRP